MNPGFVPPHLSLEFLAKAGMFHPHLPNLAGKFFHQPFIVITWWRAFTSKFNTANELLLNRLRMCNCNNNQCYSSECRWFGMGMKMFKNMKKINISGKTMIYMVQFNHLSFQPFPTPNILFSLSLFRLSQLNIYLFAYCRHDLSELSAAKYLAIIYNDSNINIQKRAIYTQSYRWRYTLAAEQCQCTFSLSIAENTQSL